MFVLVVFFFSTYLSCAACTQPLVHMYTGSLAPMEHVALKTGTQELVYGARALLPESIYLNGINFVDDAISSQALFWRSIVDGGLKYTYSDGCDRPYWSISCDLYAKMRWGAGKSVDNGGTTTFDRLTTQYNSFHRHVTLHVIPMLREIRFDLCLDSVFNTNLGSSTFTAGMFPFQVGHALSLGYAYVIDLRDTTFYLPGIIDQFQPGAMLTGDLLKDHIRYQWWIGSASYDFDVAVKERSLVQRFGFYTGQLLDGISTNGFMTALRFELYPLCGVRNKSFMIEPYFMYAYLTDNFVQYYGDSVVNLSTAGFSVEYNRVSECVRAPGLYGASFELACNLGSIDTFGLDRNLITTVTDPAGFLASVESLLTGKDISFVYVTPQVRSQVATARRSTFENFQQLIPGPTVHPALNDVNRFLPYLSDHFLGTMCIADAAYCVNGAIDVNGLFGFFSGNENLARRGLFTQYIEDSFKAYANYRQRDSKGFVGLQQFFENRRVRSVFLPILCVQGLRDGFIFDLFSNANFSRLPYTLTNIQFAGCAGVYKTHLNESLELVCHTNLIAFANAAQQVSCLPFSQNSQELSSFLVPRSLGVEWNLFCTVECAHACTIVATIATFIPGAFFTQTSCCERFFGISPIIDQDAAPPGDTPSYLVAPLPQGTTVGDAPMLFAYLCLQTEF